MRNSALAEVIVSPIDHEEEDVSLFRDAVRDVKPLEQECQVMALDRPRPSPRARFARADRQAVLQESLDAVDAADEVAEWNRAEEVSAEGDQGEECEGGHGVSKVRGAWGVMRGA